MKPMLAGMLLALSACGAAGGISGRFTGTVTPGAPSPLCPTTRAYLEIRDGHIIFAPDEGTWILDGSLGPGNAIIADRSRVAANNQIYDTTFQGRLDDNAITGTYKTPRCTSAVSLVRR